MALGCVGNLKATTVRRHVVQPMTPKPDGGYLFYSWQMPAVSPVELDGAGFESNQEWTRAPPDKVGKQYQRCGVMHKGKEGQQAVVTVNCSSCKSMNHRVVLNMNIVTA